MCVRACVSQARREKMTKSFTKTTVPVNHHHHHLNLNHHHHHHQLDAEESRNQSVFCNSSTESSASSSSSSSGCSTGSTGSNVSNVSSEKSLETRMELVDNVIDPFTMIDIMTMANIPPMAYMNGNSVRPIRQRHFSQQQTGTNNNLIDDCDDQQPQQQREQQQQQQLEDLAVLNQDQQQLVNEINSQQQQQQPPPQQQHSNLRNNFVTNGLTKTKLKQGNQTDHHLYCENQKEKLQDDQQQKYNGLNIIETNNENLIEILSKGIENCLRLAKETRRIQCTELLVPHMLMAQIASDVIDLAECEPCGLRGCLLFICIEENNSSSNNNNNIEKGHVVVYKGMNDLKNEMKQTKFVPTLTRSFPTNVDVNDMLIMVDGTNKNANDKKEVNKNLCTRRLLGEFSIDSNVVPTFEVFLTLKRVEPTWFESLENRFFKKAPIIISEVYLLNKKKLYQTSSSPLL